MEPRTKAGLLWGVIGGLSFLVLMQGFVLVTGATVTPGVMGGVALAVGAVAGAVTYALEGRIGPKEQP